MSDLKTQLISFIKVDNMTMIKSLINTDILGNSYVNNEVNKIVDILLYDRNGNNKLDLEDIILIKGDMMAITSLVSSILIILSQVSNLKYKADETEILIFKLLCYIFLVIIPEKENIQMSREEKIKIIEIVTSIHEVIKSSGIIKQIIKKIKEWIKSKCCISAEEKETILQAKLTKNKTMLSVTVQSIKTENKINNL